MHGPSKIAHGAADEIPMLGVGNAEKFLSQLLLTPRLLGARDQRITMRLSESLSSAASLSQPAGCLTWVGHPWSPPVLQGMFVPTGIVDETAGSIMQALGVGVQYM